VRYLNEFSVNIHCSEYRFVNAERSVKELSVRIPTAAANHVQSIAPVLHEFKTGSTFENYSCPERGRLINS
jgi:hypothetical protein